MIVETQVFLFFLIASTHFIDHSYRHVRNDRGRVSLSLSLSFFTKRWQLLVSDHAISDIQFLRSVFFYLNTSIIINLTLNGCQYFANHSKRNLINDVNYDQPNRSRVIASFFSFLQSSTETSRLFIFKNVLGIIVDKLIV